MDVGQRLRAAGRVSRRETERLPPRRALRVARRLHAEAVGVLRHGGRGRVAFR
jgi:hypothetical protein